MYKYHHALLALLYTKVKNQIDLTNLNQHHANEVIAPIVDPLLKHKIKETQKKVMSWKTKQQNFVQKHFASLTFLSSKQDHGNIVLFEFRQKQSQTKK